MRIEINSAATFLKNLLRMSNSLNEQQLEIFRTKLEDLLNNHYQHHWFPEQPCKGSGYRCLRINHKMDPLIAKAAEASGVGDSSRLQNLFPNELTLWIDPREVSYRIGENGSICVLFDGTLSTTTPATATTTITTNNNTTTTNNNNNNSSNNAAMERFSTCKDIVRGLDNMIMDPRNMNFEPFAAYVSS